MTQRRSIIQLTETPFRMALACAVSFVLAAVFKFAAVGLLFRLNVTRPYLRLQDVILTGALAAFFVWALLLNIQRRRRRVRQQIRAVANLNHELRNALEVILGSEYLPESDKASAVLNSVRRIERTLNELLDEHKRAANAEPDEDAELEEDKYPKFNIEGPFSHLK